VKCRSYEACHYIVLITHTLQSGIILTPRFLHLVVLLIPRQMRNEWLDSFPSCTW